MCSLSNEERQTLLRRKATINQHIQSLQEWLNDDPDMPAMFFKNAVGLIERGESQITEIDSKLADIGLGECS